MLYRRLYFSQGSLWSSVSTCRPTVLILKAKAETETLRYALTVIGLPVKPYSTCYNTSCVIHLYTRPYHMTLYHKVSWHIAFAAEAYCTCSTGLPRETPCCIALHSKRLFEVTPVYVETVQNNFLSYWDSCFQ